MNIGPHIGRAGRIFLTGGGFAAAALLAVGCGSHSSGVADQAAQQASQPSLTASAGSSASANALVTPSQPAAAQGAAAVPWDSVGPGWVLAKYGAGTPSKPAPTTLNLVSPTGAKYALHTFPAQVYLVAWSGDKTHALFKIGTTTTYQQWDLQTGKVISEFALPQGTAGVSYTSPAGQQLIGVVNTFTNTTETSIVERFNLAGKVVKILASETSSAVPTPGWIETPTTPLPCDRSSSATWTSITSAGPYHRARSWTSRRWAAANQRATSAAVPGAAIDSR